MNYIRATAALSLLSIGISLTAWADGTVVRLSEPVEVTDAYEVFGAPMPATGDGMTLQTLLQGAAKNLHKPVTVTTRVAQVCQKKGCFFVAQQGKYSARVSFKDYGFFVPSNISGRVVTLHGQLIAREVSQQQAEHFSQDAGADNVVPAGEQLEIVATAVRIPR